MAKYKFASKSKDVLPESGKFETLNSGEVKYQIFPEYIDLKIDDFSFWKEDLEELIEFLESAKEHLD